MKKSLLLVLGLFMVVSYVGATESIENPTKILRVENRNDDAVTFFERGIRFHVYLNGEFEFNTRNARRRVNRRVRIYRDYRGRINRIDNVFINYDYRGNVRRIGNVYMGYNRGRLSRVGNLRITYNRWGDPRFYGEVRRFNNFNNDYYYGNNYSVDVNLSLAAICPYNDPYFYRREFRNNYRQFREDDNFFYYRARPNANTSRVRVLKRRKQQADKGNTRNERRRSNRNSEDNNRRRR